MPLPRLARRSFSTLLALALVGCGGLTEAELDEHPEWEADPSALEEACELPVRAEADGFSQATQPLADGTPQVVYVNFDGPFIQNCAGCSDAQGNRSLVMGHFGHANGYQFQPYTNAARKAAILTHLRNYFAAYHVTFTTTRPASGPYTMAVVSPSTITTTSHGIAPLDCGNSNRNDIVFVYRANNTRRFPNAALIARAVAHELGHSFGLSHVTGTSQVMQYASSGAQFGVAPYDTRHVSGKCFTGNTQDAPALLRANVGPRP
ncbi:MAG: hypothetical protein RL653_4194 [Pseudomonadota bacterium]|jgi:hypothetical protein